MQIERHSQPKDTLEGFADKHGLVLVIEEMKSSPMGSVGRFTARFKNTETKNYTGSKILCSTFGSGSTEQAAVIDYMRSISEAIMVIDAMSETGRREIEVPALIAVSNVDIMARTYKPKGGADAE